MEVQTVPVTAEWALWGKERSDAGYRVLDCSNGTISAENFDEVLTRYSPGTLEFLPQVTISWVAGKEDRHYTALAIHDRSERARYDASGRAVVMTSYFCVPYSELAVGAVSYYSMYDYFRGVALPVAHRASLQASLPANETARAAGQLDDFAVRAAALLLTGKPVSILGADELDVCQRLMLIEAVISLLPYGMRSRFSASTWASSTFQEHRLRLFFASARRQADDHVMVWGRPDYAPIGHLYADDYLTWLREGSGERISRLAHDKEQGGFRQADILKMLERIGVAPAVVAPTVVAPVGLAGGEQPGEVEPWLPVAAQPLMTVDQLLLRCAGRLQHADPFLNPDLTRLEQFAGYPQAAEERHRYYLIIREHGLLREELRLDKQTRRRFYDVLLRLAFETPLTYEGYCLIESCLGPPPGQVHRPLLRAMADAGLGSTLMRLLVLGGIDEKQLGASLGAQPENADDLIAAAADPGLRADHAHLVCGLAGQLLMDQADRLDHEGVRAALRHHGYLAATLQLRHPEDPQYQLNQLGRLLYLGHGWELGHRDVEQILDNSMPTVALLAAVLLKSGPHAARVAEWLFVRRLVANVPFTRRVQHDLRNVLGGHEHPGGESADDTGSFITPHDNFGRGWRAHIPFRGMFREDP